MSYKYTGKSHVCELYPSPRAGQGSNAAPFPDLHQSSEVKLPSLYFHTIVFRQSLSAAQPAYRPELSKLPWCLW